MEAPSKRTKRITFVTSRRPYFFYIGLALLTSLSPAISVWLCRASVAIAPDVILMPSRSLVWTPCPQGRRMAGRGPSFQRQPPISLWKGRRKN